ncbi:alpha/beta fold hydrolase [Comamonas resistens]|uniref:Alpha/beta hydrolase n=1 Tax=Comamonas resistens TaxID=3046670 RepID=A0ABY8SNB8_9BURK|nr:alpha/beta hydrolase [Comamonas resistens]MDL5038195.1 alpha/beta hydrolase [Comamonas resistens]WHS63991.1 alpha/beta hydrolase [Comamonas resistens]
MSDQASCISTTVTARDTRVATPDGALYVKRWQPQPAEGKAPIVLMHDSLGSVALWRDFPQQLAAATGREVIAYDRLGFGHSDANPRQLLPDFVENEVKAGFTPIHQALGIGDFVLLGHSVGGGMACMTAAAYPRHCKALITESAQSFVEDRTLNGISEARDNFAKPGQLDRLSRYHGDKAAWVLSAWVDTWLSEPFAHYRLDTALKQVHCPVLAIHGELDEFGSLVHPENISAWSQGPSEVEIIAGGGHVPHRELPERITGRITRFLSDIP